MFTINRCELKSKFWSHCSDFRSRYERIVRMRCFKLMLIAISFLVISSSTLEAQLFQRSLFRSRSVYRAVVPSSVPSVIPPASVTKSEVVPAIVENKAIASEEPTGIQVVPDKSASVAAHPAVKVPAQYRNWYPYVIARPEDRDWIQQTPIELRPNRPLHFWGNSKRRMLR